MSLTTLNDHRVKWSLTTLNDQRGEKSSIRFRVIAAVLKKKTGETVRPEAFEILLKCQTMESPSRTKKRSCRHINILLFAGIFGWVVKKTNMPLKRLEIREREKNKSFVHMY